MSKKQGQFQGSALEHLGTNRSKGSKTIVVSDQECWQINQKREKDPERLSQGQIDALLWPDAD